MMPCNLVVNPKRVFLFILLFGAVSLLLLMYLPDGVKKNHIVSSFEFHRKYNLQDYRHVPATKPVEFKKRSNKYPEKKLYAHQQSEKHFYTLKGNNASLRKRIKEQNMFHLLLFREFLNYNSFAALQRPLNKTLVRDNKWKDTDTIQERRRAFYYDFCKKYNHYLPRTSLGRLVSRIFVEEKYRILYCEVPKAGCSNWKRTLMVLGGFASSTGNISHDAAHNKKYLKKLDSYDLKEIYYRLQNYTKVIFVRHPMERLVSAFRDKFEHPNKYYHPVFGRPIIKRYRNNASAEALKTGSGVTFQEFVSHVLDPLRPVSMDIHWEQINRLCHPCLVKYDFIGKSETLDEDANYFLNLIGAPKELTFPKFKDRHTTDKRTTSDVVIQYLQKLSPVSRRQICDFYNLDFLMFNYTKLCV
ncbi:carbohydrate sulfotransferase 9-like [Protopterus annectens]|uniref:carbohydrate sulfotransferase 9-like n=1 Tax=Protopterus annectens TaxID=7888 RepID=UPI001CFB6B94|nr:carbohydrate sulfotransferase 9-like [Protopterus annectens]